MKVPRLIVGAVAVFAGIACSSTTEPVRTFDFTLRLTPDSATYCDFSCSPLPTSGTMTARMTFGTPTTDLSPPYDDIRNIVRAYSDVVFADSLKGKAVVGADSIVSIQVGPPDPVREYDYYTFSGKIENGRYSGRYTAEIGGAHNLEVGSFVTVP
ncbi:MAG: hypothetical protein JWM41_473 [Gemmatimonadetes bacterium]|nr:hypothetical protein [Gemmatimonadota bacterium]